MEKEISAERTAHLYALMAWNDSYTKEQAEEIVSNTEYEKLNNITWAETSIETAIHGIREKLLTDYYLPSCVDWGRIKIENTVNVYDTIIEILQEIHDKWVVENAKKYNRGTEEKSKKNLFQHLPTALIGIDEISKDLMFLAPMLKEMGIDVGEMELTPYGSFKPSKEIINAYKRYVRKYKEENMIYSFEDLYFHIKDCINGEYVALKPTSIVGKERLKYMLEHIDILTNTVIEKNKLAFSSLSDCSTYI